MSEKEVRYGIKMEIDGVVGVFWLTGKDEAADDYDVPWQGMTPAEAYHAGFSAGLDSQ